MQDEHRFKLDGSDAAAQKDDEDDDPPPASRKADRQHEFRGFLEETGENVTYQAGTAL
jgi:hypothetical protein